MWEVCKLAVNACIQIVFCACSSFFFFRAKDVNLHTFDLIWFSYFMKSNHLADIDIYHSITKRLWKFQMKSNKNRHVAKYHYISFNISIFYYLSLFLTLTLISIDVLMCIWRTRRSVSITYRLLVYFFSYTLNIPLIFAMPIQ